MSNKFFSLYQAPLTDNFCQTKINFSTTQQDKKEKMIKPLSLQDLTPFFSGSNSNLKSLNEFHFFDNNNLNLLKNSQNEKAVSNYFLDKNSYIKIRQHIIKEMKQIKNKFNLSYETFFSAVYYLDKLCSKINFFNEKELLNIANICIILSTKFHEQGDFASLVEFSLKKFLNQNNFSYKNCELFILKELDYDLNVITAFDILNIFMKNGYVFSNENFSFKKLKFLYENLYKMIYAFIESKNFINLNSFQVALGIIAFSRESLNLEPFEYQLKNYYSFDAILDDSELKILLDKIKACLKFDSNKSNKIKNENIKKNNEIANINGECKVVL